MKYHSFRMLNNNKKYNNQYMFKNNPTAEYDKVNNS